MRLFIWNRAEKTTESWHDEGGIVVIANDISRARALIEGTCPKECSALLSEPDIARDCEGPEGIFIHPDAGCC